MHTPTKPTSSSSSPAAPAEGPTLCANCGRALGRLERPVDWRGHGVCVPCLARLTPPEEAPGGPWRALLDAIATHFFGAADVRQIAFLVKVGLGLLALLVVWLFYRVATGG
jgi:hypothetical protein